jgi:hypothetical protein
LAEKFSDRQVQCDFCDSKEAFMHTADMKHCWQVFTVCRKCRVAKKVEKRDDFIKWMESTSK